MRIYYIIGFLFLLVHGNIRNGLGAEVRIPISITAHYSDDSETLSSIYVRNNRNFVPEQPHNVILAITGGNEGLQHDFGGEVPLQVLNLPGLYEDLEARYDLPDMVPVPAENITTFLDHTEAIAGPIRRDIFPRNLQLSLIFQDPFPQEVLQSPGEGSDWVSFQTTPVLEAFLSLLEDSFVRILGNPFRDELSLLARIQRVLGVVGLAAPSDTESESEEEETL